MVSNTATCMSDPCMAVLQAVCIAEGRNRLHWKLYPAKQATNYLVGQYWQNKVSLSRDELTHWGGDKMVDILQTFSNGFSSMKIVVFLFEFHWNLFPGVRLTISSIGSGNGVILNRQLAITRTNDYPVLWCIYAALGGDELYEALSSLYDQTPPSLTVAQMITANSVRMIAGDPY